MNKLFEIKQQMEEILKRNHKENNSLCGLSQEDIVEYKLLENKLNELEENL